MSDFGAAPPPTLVVRERGQASQPRMPLVLGSYKIISLIGEGATGQVYKAEHMILGRQVALKTLRPELSKSPNLIQRFFSEARAVSEIEHENIVAISDFVSSQEHASFYIMELLEGRTLQDALCEGPLSTSMALEIGLQLSSALSAAHAKRIIHRDIKPANVFLMAGEKGAFVKLLDFGVAKLSVEGMTPLTKVGTLLGTPGYISPEGSYGMEVDERADIYSLGVVMHEMLTGRRLFEGEDVALVLDRQREGKIAPLPKEVPAKLAKLVMACLKTHPKERIASMNAVHQALLELNGALGPKLPRTLEVEAPARAHRRPPWRLAALLAAALGGAGGLWLVSYQRSAASHRAQVIIVPTNTSEAVAKPERPEPSTPSTLAAPVKSTAPVMLAEPVEPVEAKRSGERLSPAPSIKRRQFKRRVRSQASKASRGPKKVMERPAPVIAPDEAAAEAPPKEEASTERIERSTILNPFKKRPP